MCVCVCDNSIIISNIIIFVSFIELKMNKCEKKMERKAK